ASLRRPSVRLPPVLGRARPECRLIRDDARVAPDLFRASGVAQQIRVVALLPDEHEVRCGHELRDERTPRSRAWEWISAYAIPPGVLLAVLAGPDLLVDLGPARLDDARAPEPPLLRLHARNASATPGP